MTDDRSRTIDIADLAAVSGGNTNLQDALSPAGTPQRCRYVAKHLDQLGMPAEQLANGGVPRLDRQRAGFDDESLRQRLYMEHFYNCRPRSEEQ